MTLVVSWLCGRFHRSRKNRVEGECPNQPCQIQDETFRDSLGPKRVIRAPEVGLEDKFDGKLDPAGCAIQALRFAEVAVSEVGVRAAQTGMVEGVEHLGTELDVVSVVVTESSVLGDLQIQILKAGIVHADRTRRGANLEGEWLGENSGVEQQHWRIAFGGLGGELGARP